MKSMRLSAAGSVWSPGFTHWSCQHTGRAGSFSGRLHLRAPFRRKAGLHASVEYVVFP